MERQPISLTYVVAVGLIFALAMIWLGLATWSHLGMFNAYVGVPLVVGLAELPVVFIGFRRKSARPVATVTFGLSLVAFVFAIFVPFWPGPEAFVPADQFVSRIISLTISGATALLMAIPLIKKTRLGEPRTESGYAVAGR